MGCCDATRITGTRRRAWAAFRENSWGDALEVVPLVVLVG